MGAEGVSRRKSGCESLRQKDSEVFTVVFVLQKQLCTNAFALKLEKRLSQDAGLKNAIWYF